MATADPTFPTAPAQPDKIPQYAWRALLLADEQLKLGLAQKKAGDVPLQLVHFTVAERLYAVTHDAAPGSPGVDGLGPDALDAIARNVAYLRDQLSQLHRNWKRVQGMYNQLTTAALEDVYGKRAAKRADARRANGTDGAGASGHVVPEGCNPPVVFRGANCVFKRDLVGMVEPWNAFQTGFIQPMLMPSLYPQVSRGILLYGPPGVGKTELAKAVATEINARLRRANIGSHVFFFEARADELKGKYVGQTEANIRRLFECAQRTVEENSDATVGGEETDEDSDGNAEQQLPRRAAGFQHHAIIFIDEADSIARRRDAAGGSEHGRNAVNALLTNMQGFSSSHNISVILATNFPQDIDDAVVRRVGRQIHVPLPTAEEKEQLVELLVKKYLQKRLYPGAEAVDESKACEEQTPDEYGALVETLWNEKIKDSQVHQSIIGQLTQDDGRDLYSHSDVTQVVREWFVASAEAARYVAHFVQVTPEGASTPVWVSTFPDIEAVFGTIHNTKEIAPPEDIPKGRILDKTAYSNDNNIVVTYKEGGGENPPDFFADGVTVQLWASVAVNTAEDVQSPIVIHPSEAAAKVRPTTNQELVDTIREFARGP